MLTARYNVTKAMERPGNYFLAQQSHQVTMRSLLGLQSAEEAECDECLPSPITPQDCVDEASMESFPASDSPAYGAVHV